MGASTLMGGFKKKKKNHGMPPHIICPSRVVYVYIGLGQHPCPYNLEIL